jgi:dienelactone hydrolase
LRKENRRTQAWRARLGGAVEQISDVEGDVHALQYSRDGTHLLYEVRPSEAQLAAALDREGRNGFLFDRRFFPSYSPRPTQPADVNFAAIVAGARATASEQSQNLVFAYDTRTRQTRAAKQSEAAELESRGRATAPEGRPTIRGDVVSSAQGARVWTEARDPSRQGGMAPVTIAAQLDDATDPIVCVVAACTSQSIRGLWWLGNGEVLFARDEGFLLNDHALYSWRPGASEPRLLLRTADLFVSQGEGGCSVAATELICLYEGPAQPRRIVAIDAATGATRTIFDPNPPFNFDVGDPPRRLAFRTRGGVESYGYLVLPPGLRRERLPLVIVTYRCGGFLRGGSGDEYPVFPIAARGFAVLCFSVPDVDYERLQVSDWTSYLNWARGVGDPEKRRVQESLETAISQLSEERVIDPDRVAITGLSFGAETVLYALFHMPRLAAAIASGTEFGPSSNFLYGLSGREVLIPWGLGDPASPRWDALSITRNAKAVRAPLLLNVADHEMINALHPSTALRDEHRAVEMYVFPNEYHIKWQPAHRLAIYNRNIDWLNFWLQGGEDPAPAKGEQYKRWRAMRVKQCELFGKEPDAPWYCRR